MSFVALDSVSFADCSVGSVSPQDLSAHRDYRLGACALRPASPGGPQQSIPRHRPVAADESDAALRTLDDSMNELCGALHNRDSSRLSTHSSRGGHIHELCSKIDVLAQVVLRHEHELRAAARPETPLSTTALMESILQKVEAVNGLIAGSAPPRSSSSSVGRLVDAVNSATRDAATLSDRVVSPAAPLGFHTGEPIINDFYDEAHEIAEDSSASSCAARLRLSGTATLSSTGSGRITPDERSPPRVRQYAPQSGNPAAPGFEECAPAPAEDPSPRRSRGTWTTARAVPAVSVPRTATKQPEYLLQSASKPGRPLKAVGALTRQLFATSSSSSSEHSFDEYGRGGDALIAENASLKAQLQLQLQRNDRLCFAMSELGTSPASCHHRALF